MKTILTEQNQPQHQGRNPHASFFLLPSSLPLLMSESVTHSATPLQSSLPADISQSVSQSVTPAPSAAASKLPSAVRTPGWVNKTSLTRHRVFLSKLCSSTSISSGLRRPHPWLLQRSLQRLCNLTHKLGSKEIPAEFLLDSIIPEWFKGSILLFSPSPFLFVLWCVDGWGLFSPWLCFRCVRKLQFAVEVFFSGAEVDWLVAWLAARIFVL